MRDITPAVGTAGRHRERRRRGRTFAHGFAVTIAGAGALVVAVATNADASVHAMAGKKAANVFKQTNLVADNASFGAQLTDPNLTNAWGLAAAPGGPLWVADNNSGNATVYSGAVNGSAVSLQLTVPVPGGNPSGQVFNPTVGASGAQRAFPVGGAGGPSAYFIVSTDSIGATQSPGEIAAWSGGATFVVEDSPTGGPGGMTPAGAVFKGLALTTTAANGPQLLAADVANATVDIFDRNFAPVAAPNEFKDPYLPAGYAPFGIQVLKGKVYVTYVLQNAQKTDGVPGAGLGVVDVYSVNGMLMRHLVLNGPTSPLNEPWGLAMAPRHFGPFGGKLLVGNLGDGRINAFNPKTGKFLGTLMTSGAQPVTIDGLWGLLAGGGGFGGSSSVVFSAGPNAYADGVLGVLTPG